MTPEYPEQVLFIHNASGGSWEWCVWRDIFEQHDIECHIVPLDASSLDAQTTAEIDYKNQILEYAINHQIECPIIVGTGMGGMLGLQLHADLEASALVLINPLGQEPMDSFVEDPYFSAIRLDQSENGNTNGSGTATPDSEQAQPELVLNDQARGKRFVQPECPCLILIGEDEDSQSPETGNELAERLNAEVISFGGTSHIGALLGFEAKAIARQVCQWLVLRDDF